MFLVKLYSEAFPATLGFSLVVFFNSTFERFEGDLAKLAHPPDLF